jgi:ABC-type Zn2+ transport system substrate-binding protein/surface adhesin
LKTLDSANAITMAKNEEEFKNNIIELERQLDEKEQEIEELIKEHNENSE